MKEASHTKSSTVRNLRVVPEVGLVEAGDRGLSGRLAGKVSEQLELFAARMREGLLAASVAIGLDVMGEFVEAEVHRQGRRQGQARQGPRRVSPRHRGRQGHPRRAAPWGSGWSSPRSSHPVGPGEYWGWVERRPFWP